jgi:AcrR family transcriptional regulator
VTERGGGDGLETRPRRGERREQQRQRILEAARVVFFRDGFMPANLDEVAQRAGVAKGTLYRYFENKAELYVAVLSENGDAFERKMRETLVPDLDAGEQLRRLSRFYVQHWTAHREYFQIFWALENESVIGVLPDAVVAQVTALWGKCLRLLADVLERGAREGRFRAHDSWQVANVLWTLVNGLIEGDQAPAAAKLRDRALEATVEDAIELILRGLARDPA